MLKRKKTNAYQVISGKTHNGFTMVELIVVLVILAILAAVAVVSIVGYIKKSRYEQNTQNAIAVYQAAQTAISHKSSNGTLDEWAKTLAGNSLDTSNLNEVNDSIHAPFYYTYNPGDEDNPLYNLLSTYFYDQSIFNGTITVVFDVSATRDGLEKNIYSASIIGAFYSGQNPSSSNKNSAGWDSSYIDIEKGNGNVAPWNELPCTDPTFRRNNSYVGYFDGTEGSVYVPGQEIGPVVLPMTSSFEMEGHIIGPTVDGTEPTGYLFNLRNGETLDVSWAIFDEDYTLEGGYYYGTSTQHADHDETINILLRNKDVEYSDDINSDDVRLTITSTELENIVWSNTSRESFEDVDNFSIRRKSWDGFVNVSVKHGTKNLGNYTFPITKSLVIGDGRTGCPNPQYGYYEYSLSLDCMMVRADETDNNNLSSRYRISRLFEQALFNNNNQNHTPYNLYAVLLPGSKWTNYPAVNTSNNRDDISATYAARAINDPVYLSGTFGKADGIHYKYHVAEGAAYYDDPDRDSGDENNYKITGRCVVNALFGDANYSTDPITRKPIGGTSYTFQNNKVTAVDAVITSYRHLYNIRGISKDAVANYKIVRNLDWYVHETVVIDGSEKDYYASDVKVFTRNKVFNSPVANNGSLQVVSFPALRELLSNSTLSSISKSNGKIYSINNLQMRAASFRSGDAGYGLICKNSGTIYNIYTNNLNLILVAKSDGADSDYGNISSSSLSESIKFTEVNPVEGGKDIPVGGLVGLNSATIGISNGVSDNENTIRMSNTIVMSGAYWNSNTICNNVAGVIGNGTNKVNNTYFGTIAGGVIEMRGSFAVVSGGKSTAGIVGTVHSANIGARLIVDATMPDKLSSEIDLPDNPYTGEPLSCIISGRGGVAGAISWFENGEFTYETGRTLNPDSLVINKDTGMISFPDMDDDDYQVDINLSSNSLIVKNGSYDNSNPSRPVGGAIATWCKGKGEYASIRVKNQGCILISDPTKNVYCGGVVGREYSSKVKTLYIDVNNGNDSKLGYKDDTNGPLATGGAFGEIDGKDYVREGTIMINAVNDGQIVSRGADNSQGTGGAIGAVKGDVNLRYLINVINNEHSAISNVGSNSSVKTNGTGGAIGGMNSDNTKGKILEGSVIYAENKGIITGVDNVGGTIGTAAVIEGKIYSVNSGHILGTGQYTGGTVGRAPFNHYGEIQSILDGASIAGKDYVGGAAGKLNSHYDNAIVKTTVMDDAYISGTGSSVGGVCGQTIMTGSVINGIIELTGDGSAPTLEVNGSGSQIGGVAGQLSSDSDNYAVVKTPSQNPGNRLILKVSGADDVGGVIGKLYDNGKSKNIYVDLNVAFLPGSSVEGRGIDVGGAVGYLGTTDGKNKYEAKINVTSVADTAISDTFVISGKSNVGGAVGQLNSCTSNDNELDVIQVDFRYLKCNVLATGKDADGNSNAGGAIGYIRCDTATSTGSTATALPINVMLGNSNVIAASSGTGSTIYGNSVGGAIGYNAAKVGTITLSSAGMIQGNDNVGGAIGYNKKTTNCTVGDISVEITNGQVIGNSCVGGAIGNNFAVSNGKISATVVGEIAGSGDYIGGVIGYNESSLTKDIVGKITGSVTGNGNIGGIIGYNKANISATVKGTISGIVKGTSDNVAGGIGHTNSSVISGDVSVVFTVNSNNTENKVQGNNNVGGIVGFNEGTEFSSDDGISSNIPAGFSITGSGYVGGAVGRNSGTLKIVKAVVNGNIIGTGITGDVGGAIGQNNNAITKVTTTLGSGAKVKSSGSYVGGAIGDNKAKVSTVTVTSGGDIEGAGKVGGAIGQNTGTLDSINVTVEGKVCGTGSAGEVGGAIGYNEAVINGTVGDDNKKTAITVDLTGEIFAGIRDADGSLSSSYDNVGGAIGHTKNNSCNGEIIVTFSSDGKVEGGNNIGGIFGFNESTGLSDKLSCIIPINCSVRGYGSIGRVGGAIGYNNGALLAVTSTVHGVVGSVNGGNVGGAIGYNYDGKISGTVDTTITGLITSVSRDNEGNIVKSYDNVGGAIGYCIDSQYTPTNTLNIVTTDLQGNAVVEGNDNVGGAIGYCENNVESIIANITGNSKIKGGSRVGGAIGWSCAKFGTDSKYYGDVVNDGKCTGRIKSVTAVISADYALSGSGSCIGGVVGKSGDKEGSRFSSCVLKTVTVEINSRYLFDPSSTGTDSTVAACIGGAVGILAEGRLDKIILTGTGGAVNLDADVFGSEYIYSGPQVSMSGAVLIAAKGKSVGGIVGQIGLDGFTGSDNQNVSLATIDVENAPQLCVVSVNGSDEIGGWIGKGQGRRGGIGNRTNSKTTYNVTNVKLVYSQGNNVGGFCGSSIGYGSNTETYAAYITVSLYDANIIGTSGVGGAFGSLTNVYFSGGEINVSLNGRTNIGDIRDNAMPEDKTSYSAICYEAGGAVGRFDMKNYGKSFNAPIKVTFNSSLSRVWAGVSGNHGDYGVGGVFGSLINVSTAFNANARLIIEPSSGSDTSASQLLVYSKSSNAGGVIGYINAAKMDNYSSGKECYAKNVIVQVESDGGAVGGFVGKLTNKDMTLKFCYCDVNVIAGSNSYAGGFVGHMDGMGSNGTIDSCYTTAIVESTGTATGGFVGYITSGKIQNCYVGGHTYQGQYDSNDGNITGDGSVGGFVGYTSGTNTFNNCYTTASVYGSGSRIGGFVGTRSNNSTIKNCYCSGTVIGSDIVGAFAGESNQSKYDRSYALDGINDADMPLIGSSVMVGNNATLNFADKDYINRINTSGGNYDKTQDYSATPFDSSLGNKYPLRAVINKKHVGDWGIPFDGETVVSIANADVELIDNVDYKKGGVTLGENDISVIVNGTPLDYGVDYTLSYKNNNAAGEATVIIAGVPAKGYAGVLNRTFTINKVNIHDASVVISGKEYDEQGNPFYDYSGSAIVPTTEVKINGDTLVLNKDYYLIYENDSVDGEDNNHTDLGTVTVTVNGMGNYVGTAESKGNFIIRGMDIGKANITLTGNTDSELVYDGNAKEPGVIVRIGGQTRVKDVDYTVTYENNVNAGTATIIIEGQGILRGTKTRTFEITTADNSWVITPSINGWTWSWDDDTNAQSPTGTARFGEVEYKYYTDVNCTTLTDSENSGAASLGGQPVNAGTYYLKAFVESGYWVDDNNVNHYNYKYLDRIVAFTIMPFNISSVSTVEIDPNVYCVTGSAIEPKSSDVTVIAYSGDDEHTLVYNDDYSIRYINNVNVGEATAIVEGKGNYSGTCRGTFTIRQPIVTFDSCGGTEVDPSELSIVYGRTVSRPASDPVRESGTDEYNWRFDGWYDNESYEGGTYNFSSAVTGDVKLYAKWVKQHTVTFCITTDENADNPPSTETVYVDAGTSVVAPTAPEWEGLTFAGWYKNDPLMPVDPDADPSEIGLYDFDTNVDENMILYAKWQATVSFVIVGKKADEENPASLPVDYNSSADISENELYSTVEIRTRDGETGKWIYDGWYLDEDLKKPFDPSVVLTGDVTLYTKWNKVHEVKYIVSDSESYSVPVYVGKSVSEPTAVVSDIYTSDLYDFDGWYKDEACTSPVDFTASIYADVTYYAKWTEKEYTLSFDSNGGTGTMDAITVTSVTGVSIPANSFIKEGCVFLGWSTDPNATEAMYDNEAVLTLSADTKVYAVWVEDPGG